MWTTGASVSLVAALVTAGGGGIGIYFSDPSHKQAAIAKLHEMTGKMEALEKKAADTLAAKYKKAAALIHLADKDGDGLLSHDELAHGAGPHGEGIPLPVLVLAAVVALALVSALIMWLVQHFLQKKGTLKVDMVTASHLSEDTDTCVTVEIDGTRRRTDKVKGKSKTASFQHTALEFPVRLTKGMKAGNKIKFDVYHWRGIKDAVVDMVHGHHETIGTLSFDLKDVQAGLKNGKFESKDLTLEAPVKPKDKTGGCMPAKPKPVGKVKFTCTYTDN